MIEQLEYRCFSTNLHHKIALGWRNICAIVVFDMGLWRSIGFRVFRQNFDGYFETRFGVSSGSNYGRSSFTKNLKQLKGSESVRRLWVKSLQIVIV